MRVSLIVLSVLLIILSLFPLVKEDYWVFRVFEYPRIQKLFITLIVLVFYVFLVKGFKSLDYLLVGGLIVNAIYLLVLILPFTVLAPKQVKNNKKYVAEDAIKLMIFNVYQYNKETAVIKELIKTEDPDVICLVETDQWWLDQVNYLKKEYPYNVLEPLDNTYGILLFSKLKLENGQVKYRVKDDIPSIDAIVSLRSGQRIKLHCVHPEPPVPNENPKSTARDKELLLVAKESKKDNLPVIVMGDLNDVAWSYTTELFCKTSELLDPRKGRGFFNTFNAKIPILRFPLDHVFCSDDFYVNDIKRLPHANSDHFPMFINLQYLRQNTTRNKVETASPDEKELAKEKINKEAE